MNSGWKCYKRHYKNNLADEISPGLLGNAKTKNEVYDILDYMN